MENHEISFKEKPINPVKSLAPVFQSVDYATLSQISFTSRKVDGSNLVVLVPSCVYQGWQYAGQGESNPRLRIVFFFYQIQHFYLKIDHCLPNDTRHLKYNINWVSYLLLLILIE